MDNSITLTEPCVEVNTDNSVVEVNVVEHAVEFVIGTSGPQGPRGTQVLTGTSDPSPVVGLVGDQYINVATGFIFGPKTEEGWGTGTQLGVNGLTISDVSFTFYQVSPSNVWNISHTLDFTPNVTVVDLNGKVIEGDYVYGIGTITATFSESITGAAYLS